jgi:hypothetical protein
MIQFQTVTIKQIPDEFAYLTGLDKHNRSKMPGTYEVFQAQLGPDGRYITGFDEKALAVRQIVNKEKREAKEKELQELRESLERLTGVEDLSGTSPFWATYQIKLVSDRELVLNGENPADVIKYCVLLSNRFVSPDKESAAYPEYQQTKYYCYTTEKVEQETVSAQKAKDRARAKLLDISEDKEKMALIGQYLEGDKYKATMSPNTLYRMLSDYIESKDTDNRKRFIKAFEAGVEDLQYKIAVDRAIKKKVIRFEKGYYSLGSTVLGKTPGDVLSNLKTPEFASAFLQIRDEVTI